MTAFRFYLCQEIRCPKCFAQLRFLTAKKGEPLLIEHERSRIKCELNGKKFYASPLVVELEEYGQAERGQ